MKLVDHYMYLGSNISFTENDIYILIGKPCTAIDRLSTIWECDHSEKIKWEL